MGGSGHKIPSSGKGQRYDLKVCKSANKGNSPGNNWELSVVKPITGTNVPMEGIMPKKRPLQIRLEETEDKLDRLVLEMKINELQEKIKSKQKRKRRR